MPPLVTPRPAVTTTETPAPETAPAAEPPLARADGVELAAEYKDSGFKDRAVDRAPQRRPGRAAPAPAVPRGRARRRQPQPRRDRHPRVRGRPARRRRRRRRHARGEPARARRARRRATARARRSRRSTRCSALKFKTAVIPERVTRAFTTVFRPLFAKPVVALVVPALLALDVWLLFIHGISPGLREVIYSPVLLLMLLGGVVVATAFHEIGHATACRYGGARPGVMGVGIYVVWPAFYTDVTDAYRLGKGGPSADGPRRHLLQRDLRARHGRAVRRHELRAAAAARADPELRDDPAAAAAAGARRLLHHQRPHRRAGHVLAHQAGAAERAARAQGERPRDRAQAVRAPRGDRVRPHGGADARLLVRPDAAARAARVRHRLRLARRAVGQGRPAADGLAPAPPAGSSSLDARAPAASASR